MSVMVMDVEGTDGRERGEDQVRPFSYIPMHHTNEQHDRILSANLRFSLLLPPKF